VTTNLHPLHIRRVLNDTYGRRWDAPREHGPDGWSYVLPPITERFTDGTAERHSGRSVIVSCADHDGDEWVHASLAGTETPTYVELTWLHRAVFRDGYAYQVFAPRDKHVNIHEHALHLWGRLDGTPALPEFSGALMVLQDGQVRVVERSI